MMLCLAHAKIYQIPWLVVRSCYAPCPIPTMVQKHEIYRTFRRPQGRAAYEKRVARQGQREEMCMCVRFFLFIFYASWCCWRQCYSCCTGRWAGTQEAISVVSDRERRKVARVVVIGETVIFSRRVLGVVYVYVCVCVCTCTSAV